MMIENHPILGELEKKEKITFEFDGRTISAHEGEPIAAALLAAGVKVLRYTEKLREPRGISCALGRCTDCVMIVNGVPNVRTCVTPVQQGMKVETQHGLGIWRNQP